MKRNASFFVLGMLLTLSLSFAVAYEPTLATAEVEKVEGIYIFYRSEPVKEYEYIGTHKVKLSWTGQPDEMFGLLVKKSKKKFPELQAIIISDDMEKCDAIKFK